MLVLPPQNPHRCLARAEELVGCWHGKRHCLHTGEAQGLMLVGICRRQMQLGSRVNLDIRGHLSAVVMRGEGEDSGEAVQTNHSFHGMLTQKVLSNLSTYRRPFQQIFHDAHCM